MTTILRTAISVTILHMVDVGVAWVWLYSSHSQGGFLPRSQGHRQFSSVVTQSQTVFGQTQVVTPAAALSMAHIGMSLVC